MRVSRWLAVALALAAAGCSASKEKPVFKVTGRVTAGGVPVSKGRISFYPVDQKDRDTAAHGATDEDGRYALHTYRAGDGAPAGEYIVTIYWPGPARRKAPADEPDGEASAPDRLKNQYLTPGKSKLRATVERKENTIDFQLP